MPSIIGNMPIDKKQSIYKKAADTAVKFMNENKKQGSQDGHHVTTVPPKKNAMNKSERDFEAGQKLKAAITKKTGVYPNTAN